MVPAGREFREAYSVEGFHYLGRKVSRRSRWRASFFSHTQDGSRRTTPQMAEPRVVFGDAFPKMEREGRENVHHILAPPPRLLGPISGPQGGCQTRGGGCCCPSNKQGSRRRAQPRRYRRLRSLAARKILGEARAKPRKSASAERGKGQAHELQSLLPLPPT